VTGLEDGLERDCLVRLAVGAAQDDVVSTSRTGIGRTRAGTVGRTPGPRSESLSSPTTNGPTGAPPR